VRARFASITVSTSVLKTGPLYLSSITRLDTSQVSTQTDSQTLTDLQLVVFCPLSVFASRPNVVLTMKAFVVVVVLFLATLAFSASEGKDGKGEKTTSSAGSGYRFYGPDNMFKPRPARWQSGAAPGPINPAMAENELEYYPKLFNLLEQIGRR